MPEPGLAETGKVLLQVRLPKELVKQLDHACVDWERTRVELVEELLREGLKDYHGPPTARS